MAGIGKLAAAITAAALAGSPVQAENPRDFSGLIESGNPLVSSVIKNTQQSTSHLMQDTGMIVLAQAEIGKKEYVVYVRQVDANGNLTDKTVEVRYTKNERWAIVLPKTTDKLLDGRPLTWNPVEDRVLNREILGKYDKDKQIILAMNSKEDIVWDAVRKLDSIMKKMDEKNVNKTDLYNAYYAIYIFVNGSTTEKNKRNTENMLLETDNYGKSILKMSLQEIEMMRLKARDEAQKQWQSVTRSLG